MPDPLFDLSNMELLSLLAVVSKACEFKDTLAGALVVQGKDIDAAQITELLNRAERLLGRLDTRSPGLLPVPHDGRTWRQRLEEADG